MESPEGASQGMDTQEEDTQAELPNSTNGLEEAYIDAQRLALPPCHNTTDTHKKACIDDLMLLEKISLSNQEEQERIIGPLPIMEDFT